MVTIITGFPLDNPTALSGPMQVGLGQQEGTGWEVAPAQAPSDVTASPAPTNLSSPFGPFPQAALQAAAHASVDVQNVLDFYKQWKEIG